MDLSSPDLASPRPQPVRPGASAPERRALIVVDVQNDFCPGGSLAVQGGDGVASRISSWIASDCERYDMVVATMDWHPAPGELAQFDHFSEHPDYSRTWPPHCMRGSFGAELHPNLVLPHEAVVVRKGQDAAAYSGFEGSDTDGTPLIEILRRNHITAVDVVGLATDYCVKATAMDARKHGLTVRVITDLVAGVAATTTETALQEMLRTGVTIDSGSAPRAGSAT